MTDAKQILRQPASWGGVKPQGPSAPGVPNTQGTVIMELWHNTARAIICPAQLRTKSPQWRPAEGTKGQDRMGVLCKGLLRD